MESGMYGERVQDCGMVGHMEKVKEGTGVMDRGRVCGERMYVGTEGGRQEGIDAGRGGQTSGIIIV